jgi:hypothetical protein
LNGLIDYLRGINENPDFRVLSKELYVAEDIASL